MRNEIMQGIQAVPTRKLLRNTPRETQGVPL